MNATGRIEPVARLAVDEGLWLLGQPGLDELLQQVADEAVGGAALSRATLVQRWRFANDRYHQFELSGDETPVSPEPERLAGEPLSTDPRHRAAFAAAPTEVAVVALDRLIVSRPFLTGGLEAPNPATPAALAAFTLPADTMIRPARVTRLASGRYLFASNGLTLVEREPAPIDPNLLAGALAADAGPLAGALAIPVGAASPLMRVVRSEQRNLLIDGHRRVFALLAAGISHAPCLVHHVTRTDELALVAGDDVSDRAAFFFRAKRPPLMRDFLDPGLTLRLPVVRHETVIEIEIKIRGGRAAEVSAR